MSASLEVPPLREELIGEDSASPVDGSAAEMWKGIAILVIGSVALTCVLTPPIFSGLVRIFPDFPWPFSRVFDRVFMLCALCFVVALRHRFRLGALRAYLVPGEHCSRWGLVAIGISISLLASSASMLYLLGSGDLVWGTRTAAQLAWRIVKVLPAALLISLIEESFFRVLLYVSLRRMLSPWPAAALCSVAYAAVHFIIPDKRWEYPGLSFTAGFEYLGIVLGDVVDASMLPAFVGLFAVGIGLCRLIERTKSLYLCIGLHAGWVMAIKLVSFAAPIPNKDLIREEALRRYYLVAQPFSWLTILAAFAMAHLAIHLLGRGKHDR